MRNSKTNGFTLIELLIVIAIIGILAAVLIPNLLAARTRANDTVAQTCAKGLATASEVQNVDNNTYVGLTAANALDWGANACSNANLNVGLNSTAATATTYEHTVGHTGGSQTYTVTQDGIVGAAGVVASASPLAAAP